MVAMALSNVIQNVIYCILVALQHDQITEHCYNAASLLLQCYRIPFLLNTR